MDNFDLKKYITEGKIREFEGSTMAEKRSYTLTIYDSAFDQEEWIVEDLEKLGADITNRDEDDDFIYLDVTMDTESWGEFISDYGLREADEEGEWVEKNGDFRLEPLEVKPKEKRKLPNPDRPFAPENYDFMENLNDDDLYEASPAGFGTGTGRSRTVSKGREFNPNLKDKLKTQEPKSPSKYVMVGGIPHKFVDGKLVPLKKKTNEGFRDGRLEAGRDYEPQVDKGETSTNFSDEGPDDWRMKDIDWREANYLIDNYNLKKENHNNADPESGPSSSDSAWTSYTGEYKNSPIEIQQDGGDYVLTLWDENQLRAFEEERELAQDYTSPKGGTQSSQFEGMEQSMSEEDYEEAYQEIKLQVMDDYSIDDEEMDDDEGTEDMVNREADNRFEKKFGQPPYDLFESGVEDGYFDVDLTPEEKGVEDGYFDVDLTPEEKEEEEEYNFNQALMKKIFTEGEDEDDDEYDSSWCKICDMPRGITDDNPYGTCQCS